MQNTPIAFLGAGNMGRSLIGGLTADGMDAALIHVYEPDEASLDALVQATSIRPAGSNTAAAQAADVIVFAVKPQILQQVAREIAPVVAGSNKLIVSIAAGIRVASMENWLGAGSAIVRVMPNTPALVRAGASGLYANAAVTSEQHNQAEAIMRSVGLTVWVDDEAMIDTVTALSGSGPAYFFAFIEALEAGAKKLGMDADTARLLAIQTAFGAAKIALESHDDPATLRAKVTSPGGTTEAALAVLQAELPDIVNRAMGAAHRRSRELSDAFGGDD